MIPPPVDKAILATSEAAPVNWSSLAMAGIGALATWLTFRGKQVDGTNARERRLFRRIEKLEQRSEQTQAKLDEAKEGLRMAQRALEDAEEMIRERDVLILRLKDEVNEVLITSGRSPRYDAEGRPLTGSHSAE